MNRILKYLLLLAAYFLGWGRVYAEPGIDPRFAVTQVSDNQIVVNRLALNASERYEVIESYPAKTVDGPWSEAGARIEFNASALANEQLNKFNPAKSGKALLPAKKSALAEISKNHDIDIKRLPACNTVLEQISCSPGTPIYRVNFSYKYSF